MSPRYRILCYLIIVKKIFLVTLFIYQCVYFQIQKINLKTRLIGGKIRPRGEIYAKQVLQRVFRFLF